MVIYLQIRQNILSCGEIAREKSSMKITVLNGSPKGSVSVTMQYVRYLDLHFKDHEFKTYNISQKIKKIEKNEDYFNEIIDSIKESGGVIWAFPVYYMLVPSNYKRFIEMIFEKKCEPAFSGKYTAALSTSKHFYDHTAHNYIHAICDDLNMRYIDFHSADMYDLTEKDKQRELVLFAGHFFNAIKNNAPASKSYIPVKNTGLAYSPGQPVYKTECKNKKILLLTDCTDENSNLKKMADRFKDQFSENIDSINLHDINIKGSCLGCVRCGYKNECVYKDKDEFVNFFETRVRTADIIVYAGEVKDRFLSSRWKMYFDRCFYLGHIPLLWGKQLAFIVSGPLGKMSTLREFIHGYSEMQRATLVDIITDEYENSKAIDDLIESLSIKLIDYSDEKFTRPPTQLGVGGRKIFRDIIYEELRFPFIADHKFYKKHRFYDYRSPAPVVRIFSLLLKTSGFRNYINKNVRHLMLEPFNKVFKKKDGRNKIISFFTRISDI